MFTYQISILAIAAVRHAALHCCVLDILTVGWLNGGGVSRELMMLKGHLPRVIYFEISKIGDRCRERESSLLTTYWSASTLSS